MLTIVKAIAGTQYHVVDHNKDGQFVIKSFDDKVKAQGFIDELRKADNDRLSTLQEEVVQTTERSDSLDKRREEEVRRD